MSDRPTIRQLTRELADVVDFEGLGIALGVPDEEIRAIMVGDPKRGVASWKISLFSLWLRSDMDASWEKVISALKEIGEKYLAKRLRKEYCIPRESGTKHYVTGIDQNDVQRRKQTYSNSNFDGKKTKDSQKRAPEKTATQPEEVSLLQRIKSSPRLQNVWVQIKSNPRLQNLWYKIKSSPTLQNLWSRIESSPRLRNLWSRIEHRPIRAFFLAVLFVFFLALFVYIIFPGRVSPVSVYLPTCEEREMNDELKKAKRLFEEEIQGPEAFVVDKDGNMYTGLGDGRVVRFTDRNIETVVRLGPPPYGRCGQMTIEDETRCGRPLGLAIASSTAPYDLYIADCYHGILVYNLMTKELTTLINTTIPREGIPPMKLVNSIALLSNGSIFFTDSSSKFGRADVLLDILEGAGNGKLMHYDPSTESLSVVVSDMAFPNGVCVSPSEDFLLVVETSRARILKYYLSGPKAGTTDIFADNLPGIPDNISPASTGGYWVGSGASRQTGLFDLLARSPWAKTIIAKFCLTGLLHRLVPKTGMIYRLSSDGEIQEVLWDSGSEVISDVSSVLDMGDKLYLGSFSAPYMGRLDLK